MSEKKELAIVLGATGNMAFALANVLIGLKKYSTKKFDAIVFEQDISLEDKKLLSSILECKFIEYKYPSLEDNHSEITRQRFTELTFSRYECLSLLEEYKSVLWLDIDLLIKGDVTKLIEEYDSDIALWQSKKPLSINFTKKLTSYNTDISFFNPGVMLFKDSFASPNEVKQWCYNKTNELASILYCGDQGIINIMLQEFKPDLKNVDEKYNCHPRLKTAKNAIILHPYCAEKFWNFYNNKEWNENYKKWIKMGGTPYKGTKVGNFERFVKRIFPEVPNPLKYPKNFVKYFQTKKYKDFDFY